MVSAQIISAGLEVAINQVLALDEDSQHRLSRLSGKRCEVLPIELDIPLLFIFTKDKVLVTSPLPETSAEVVSLEKKIDNDLECRIKLSVFAISELQNMSNLTRLIREEKLDFEGNLNIAQQFADLFKQLDIDLEEILSKYVGDAVAHTFMKNSKHLGTHAKQQTKLAKDALSDFLLDEKPIAVRAIMIENYNMQINDLRSATDRLDARVTRLEKKWHVAKILASKQNDKGPN